MCIALPCLYNYLHIIFECALCLIVVWHFLLLMFLRRKLMFFLYSYDGKQYSHEKENCLSLHMKKSFAQMIMPSVFY